MRQHRRLPAIAAMVLLGAGLAACDPAGQPSAQSSTVAAPASPTPAGSPSSTAAPALGPTGYGVLELGMTKAQARATGKVTGMDDSDKGTCGQEGFIQSSPNPSDPADGNTGGLFFSAGSDTLVAIYAFPGVQTPEGITLGSTYEQVHAAYPAWKGVDEPYTSGRGLVAVPGNTQANYRIVIQGDKVTSLALQSAQQDCYE